MEGGGIRDGRGRERREVRAQTASTLGLFIAIHEPPGCAGTLLLKGGYNTDSAPRKQSGGPGTEIAHPHFLLTTVKARLHSRNERAVEKAVFHVEVGA